MISKESIVIEVNNIGYKIFVSSPSLYALNDEYKIYLYHVIKEDDEYLIGFSSLEERSSFLLLLNVKGIGPKTAISILGKVDSKQLMNAIASNNIIFLKNLPNVGAKGAAQILLDLRGKIDVTSTASINQYENVKAALKKIGYKSTHIERVLTEINIPNASDNEILKEALRRLGPTK